jgi:hypothetical protein
MLIGGVDPTGNVGNRPGFGDQRDVRIIGGSLLSKPFTSRPEMEQHFSMSRNASVLMNPKGKSMLS